MNVSRRKPVLLLALLSASVLGFCEIATRPAAPAGWKTERWEAGFGSWSRGGFGVAYDVQMPNAYDFQQKCGTAWISDNVDGPDFTIRMSFRPRPKDRQDDFNDYLAHDASQNYQADRSSISFSQTSSFRFGSEPVSRLNFELKNVRFLEDAAGAPAKSGTVRGFWLDGRNLSIIADLRDPERFAVNERIVASARRVSGYGLLDLIRDDIPGLLGC